MRLDPLLPVPVLVFVAVAATALVVARVSRGTEVVGVTRWIATILLAFAVVLDPATTDGSSDARRTAADVLFVVDSTSSMAAIDFDGGSPRLDGVRADILEIAAEFPGAHFALVRFDSQARIELPWTTNVNALETAVAVIRQERAEFSRGSVLDLANPVIDQMIPRPGNVPGSSGRAGSHSIVFYFSDGEQRRLRAPDEQPLDLATAMIVDDSGTDAPVAFTDLATKTDGGAILGYGTADGAPMIEFRGSDEIFTGGSPYVTDYASGSPAISRLDETRLRRIADDWGLPYIPRSEPGGLRDLASALADEAPVVSDGARETLNRWYWVPALGLLALVIWQAVVSVSEARTAKLMFAAPHQVPVAAAPPRRATTPVGASDGDRVSA